MLIGVPKEIKNHEYRVGLVPATVRELTARGHEVFVETGAGSGIGLEPYPVVFNSRSSSSAIAGSKSCRYRSRR